MDASIQENKSKINQDKLVETRYKFTATHHIMLVEISKQT